MLDQAIEHYKEALRIRREFVEIDASFKPKLADALSNLANAYYSRGLLDQAVEYYKEALKVRRQLVEVDKKLKPKFANTLDNIGGACIEVWVCLIKRSNTTKEALRIRRELVGNLTQVLSRSLLMP